MRGIHTVLCFFCLTLTGCLAPIVKAGIVEHAKDVREAHDLCLDDDSCPGYVLSHLDALADNAECLASAVEKRKCETPRPPEVN